MLYRFLLRYIKRYVFDEKETNSFLFEYGIAESTRIDGMRFFSVDAFGDGSLVRRRKPFGFRSAFRLVVFVFVFLLSEYFGAEFFELETELFVGLDQFFVLFLQGVNLLFQKFDLLCLPGVSFDRFGVQVLKVVEANQPLFDFLF